MKIQRAAWRCSVQSDTNSSAAGSSAFGCCAGGAACQVLRWEPIGL